MPNLSVVAEAPATVWELTTIANWHGESERLVELTSETAVWYSTGLFAVPVRWVLVRDPQGQFKTQALLCSDLEADPQKILSWFVMRRQLAAFGERPGTRRAIQSSPMRLRWCARSCGLGRLFASHPGRPTP